MKLTIPKSGESRNLRDIWAGAFFMALGGGAAIFSVLNYRLGTPGNMGPGFFPALVGTVIGLLGVAIAGLALRTEKSADMDAEEEMGSGLWPLVSISCAVLAFAILLRPFGLIISVAALVLIGRLARWGSWLEMAVLTAVIVVIAYVIFVIGLRMPFKVMP